MKLIDILVTSGLLVIGTTLGVVFAAWLCVGL